MLQQPTNSDLDKALGILSERVEQNHAATIQRFDAGMELVLEKLKPIEKLQTMVAKHDRQINFWKGSIAVLAAVWAATISAAVAIGAALLKRGH